MKNSLFLVCLVLCFMASGVGQAQNRYYFNEGDTIYGRDTTYFYQWWSEQWLASDPMHKLFLEPDQTEALWAHGKIVQYFYTEHPINVVGIATSFFNYNMRFPPTPCDTLPERQEYVLLYEADTSRLQFYEVGRAPIDYSKPARYMNVDLRYNVGSPQGYSDNDYCCNVAPDKNYVIKIREYYFDKPITVRDSFYVGHTTYSNYWPDPEHGDWIYNISAWSLSYYPMNRHNECSPDELNCDTLPYQKYKFKQTDFQLPNGIFDTNEWYCFQFPAWKIEFPIIEIDSSFYDGPPQYVCPQVQNFRIAQAAENTVVFLWDTHGDHQYWQMSYGPAGTEPDDGCRWGRLWGWTVAPTMWRTSAPCATTTASSTANGAHRLRSTSATPQAAAERSRLKADWGNTFSCSPRLPPRGYRCCRRSNCAESRSTTCRDAHC